MTQTQAVTARAQALLDDRERPVRRPASRHGPVPRPDGPGTQRPGSHAAERTRRRNPANAVGGTSPVIPTVHERGGGGCAERPATSWDGSTC